MKLNEPRSNFGSLKVNKFVPNPTRKESVLFASKFSEPEDSRITLDSKDLFKKKNQVFLFFFKVHTDVLTEIL